MQINKIIVKHCKCKHHHKHGMDRLQSFWLCPSQLHNKSLRTIQNLTWITNFLNFYMLNWKTLHSSHKVENWKSNSSAIKWGNFQRDSLSSLLFCLSLILLYINVASRRNLEASVSVRESWGMISSANVRQ